MRIRHGFACKKDQFPKILCIAVIHRAEELPVPRARGPEHARDGHEHRPSTAEVLEGLAYSVRVQFCYSFATVLSYGCGACVLRTSQGKRARLRITVCVESHLYYKTERSEVRERRRRERIRPKMSMQSGIMYITLILCILHS